MWPGFTPQSWTETLIHGPRMTVPDTTNDADNWAALAKQWASQRVQPAQLPGWSQDVAPPPPP
ncbi:hypothetical protein P879_02822, partial [Paragonimus westermani]